MMHFYYSLPFFKKISYAGVIKYADYDGILPVTIIDAFWVEELDYDQAFDW